MSRDGAGAVVERDFAASVPARWRRPAGDCTSLTAARAGSRSTRSAVSSGWSWWEASRIWRRSDGCEDMSVRYRAASSGPPRLEVSDKPRSSREARMNNVPRNYS